MTDKREKIALVLALYAFRTTSVQIGEALGFTSQHAREILEDCNAPLRPFDTTGQFLTWLASNHPELELRVRAFREQFLRDHLRNASSTPQQSQQAA